MTTQELEAQLAEAQKKIAELELQNKKKKKGVELKVSQKGCVQINGIRKFPFTFYVNDIEQIFGMKEEIETFIQDNKSELATK